MKELLKAKNFLVQEVEQSDFDKWIKEEFKETHPLDLIKATFPEKVMQMICSDHHKSKDYSFNMGYDHQNKTWYIEHNGYIREAEARGKHYLDVAQEYLEKIRRENDKVLYRQIEDEASKYLPDHLSIEIAENCISLNEYKDGFDNCKCITSLKHNGLLNVIIRKVNEILDEWKENQDE